MSHAPRRRIRRPIYRPALSWCGHVLRGIVLVAAFLAIGFFFFNMPPLPGTIWADLLGALEVVAIFVLAAALWRAWAVGILLVGAVVVAVYLALHFFYGN